MSSSFGGSAITENKLRVETPFGTLIAYASADLDYPGIYIDLRREGMDCDMAVALVEYTETEADIESSGHLITRVWGNGKAQDYTDRVIHRNVEDFFKLI